MKAYRLLPVVCLMLLFLAGCALFQRNASSVDSLTKKVNQLWQHKVKKEWLKVYEMTSAFHKKEVTPEEFISLANVDIKDYKIDGMDIIEPGKKVSVKMSYTIFQMGYTFHPITKEEWVFENGDWYFNLLPIKYSPPPFGYGLPVPKEAK